MGRQREYGLDLIRATAALLVLAVHFFLNSGYYETPLQGPGMLAATVLRMACMSCVPLFMLLTGWLCGERRWSGRYWMGLAPVLAAYLAAAGSCLLFQTLWLGERMSPLGIIRRLLDFSAAPYGWYVEMYVGLFLLIPFLNAAWRGLSPGGQKGMLLVLLMLTAMPALTNVRVQLLPDWWSGIYPITYYVTGAWLREHPITVGKGGLLLGWVVAAGASGALCFAMAGGGNFLWAPINDWGSPLVMAGTVLLFSLLGRADGSRTPRTVRRCVSRVAALSLPIYLVSYVGDQMIYPVLRETVPTVEGRLPWMPLTVSAVLLLSILLAHPVDWAGRALVKLLPRGRG